MSSAVTLVELRRGTTADLPTVDSIMREAFDPRYGEAWTRGQCLGIMAMPGVWLTMASIDGVSVGFALSRLLVDEVELLLLATRPARRRCGIGRALVASVIDTAREQHASRVHLEVRSGNDAIKLYAATGFHKVGERLDYYRGANGQLFDAMTFSRQIA